jgi:hypothetical protein
MVKDTAGTARLLLLQSVPSGGNYMYMNSQDEIVESRTWSSGVEIVAHVNWSLVARVRRALGFAGDELGRGQFSQVARSRPLTLHSRTGLRRAAGRAA